MPVARAPRLLIAAARRHRGKCVWRVDTQPVQDARESPVTVLMENGMATVSTRSHRRRPAQRISSPTSDDIEVPAKSDAAAAISFIEPGRRHALICEAAYFLAERRGFCPGQELDDWLAAESEIDRTLQAGGAGT